ncbi:hypothetical protein AURDEDRAFT_166190 [Auricularia subglabra TFB-10046 SS5]|nr:hypothetical protein AURDEDRAFT_166190 [Auricularia subglabra TFB-10046 SS5]
MDTIFTLCKPQLALPETRVVGDEDGMEHILPQLKYHRPFHLVDDRYPEHDIVCHIIEVPAYKALAGGAVTSNNILVELSEVYHPAINRVVMLARFLLPEQACKHPIASGAFMVAERDVHRNDLKTAQACKRRSYFIVALKELEEALVKDTSKIGEQMLEWLWSVDPITACEYDPKLHQRAGEKVEDGNPADVLAV